MIYPYNVGLFLHYRDEEPTAYHEDGERQYIFMGQSYPFGHAHEQDSHDDADPQEYLQVLSHLISSLMYAVFADGFSYANPLKPIPR
jgi:hypothetical protein